MAAEFLSDSARRAKEALASVDAAPGVSKPDPILIAENVRRNFGGVVAVDVDHLEVQRGSITALIGPNGAGKTTLFNLLTGFDTPNEGKWMFDGRNLEKVVAHRTASMGMVRTFQLTKSLTKMSVIENMKLGATQQVGEKWWNGLLPFRWKRQEDIIEKRADELLKRFKLDHMRNEYAGTLSGGQRKLLEMSRALMTNPRVLLMDEPASALDPISSAKIEELIWELKKDYTILIVTHNMQQALRVSDYTAFFLAEDGNPGRVVEAGPTQQVFKSSKDKRTHDYVNGLFG